MTNALDLLGPRPLNGFSAVGLLLTNVILARSLKTYQDTPPKFFYFAAGGWFFNLAYLFFDNLREAIPKDDVALTHLIALGVWIANIGTYVAFIGASRWQRKIPLGWFADRYRLFALALVGSICAVAAEFIPRLEPVILGVIVVFGAISIAVLALAYTHMFASSEEWFPERVRRIVVAPLFLYALIQFGAFAAPPYQRNGSDTLLGVLLLLGLLLKLAHLVGLLEYISHVFKELQHRALIPDPYMVRQMAEQLAHELNTPALELKLKVNEFGIDAKTNGQTEAINRIVEQIVAASDSFQDYLGQHRPEKPQPVEQINLNVACDHAIMTVKGTMKQAKQVTFRPDYSGGIRVNVVPSELQQILRNLFKNAVEAITTNADTEHENILRIATRHVEGMGGAVAEVIVADSGHGVPQGWREKIFRDGVSTRNGVGRGHGLHIASRLAEKNGGHLTLLKPASELAVGATFSLTLPLASTETIDAKRRRD